MTPTPVEPPAAAARAARPRTTGFGTTGFGPTGFGSTVFDPAAAAAGPRSVFDVCHLGVLLRACVFVQTALVIGVAFTAGNLTDALVRIAGGAGVALPAVLMWLLAACTFKRPLARAPLPLQWLASAAFGGASAFVAAALVGPLAPELLGRHPLLAPTLAGAGLAVVVFHWLQLRARAMLPADTTARLAELQSRIRPHFLFNTLNTALALVRVDPARAEGVLEDLAELFRVALTDSGESVTLADEVELAQRYLAIEQIRFGSRLAVSWDLDPAAATARMPPLLLQPLVENAVRHGVEPADAGGTIRVRTRVKAGRAVVSIDNSVAANASQPGSGIALKNVRERLRLMHDVAVQFDARRVGDMFKVLIVVPL